MKKYVAYCRVSTKAQADMDNSLPAQKRIITEYAQRKEFEIVDWFSEAKSGFKGKRTEFHKMLQRLTSPEIEGVVFHKLDRSSRNVADFALLDQLVTQHKKKMVVIEGEFDTSRAAGRLAFRNFCNMAVWYSENLSEEVSTKMEEVLLKGYFPAPPPIGYRSGIKGVDDDHKKKQVDPKVAPFVKESFKLFSSGNYSAMTLCDYMRKRGMTNGSGNPIRKSMFYKMLRNPFYHGLMMWRKKGSDEPLFYEGNHEPLITKKLFDQVQEILDGRTQKNKMQHDFTYSKMFKCECGRYMVSSYHKTHIYLECHNPDCRQTIREDRLEDQIVAFLAKYELADEFIPYAKEAIERLSSNIRVDNAAKRKALDLKLNQIDQQLEKLNRAVLDGYFTSEEGLARKNELIDQRHTLRAQIGEKEDMKEDVLWALTLELIQIFDFLPYRYRELNPLVKRKVLNVLSSNRELKGQFALIQAIPAIEKLKAANYLIQGQKLLLNHEPNGGDPIKKAFPTADKVTSGKLKNSSKSGEVLYGGSGWN